MILSPLCPIVFITPLTKTSMPESTRLNCLFFDDWPNIFFTALPYF